MNHPEKFWPRHFGARNLRTLQGQNEWTQKRTWSPAYAITRLSCGLCCLKFFKDKVKSGETADSTSLKHAQKSLQFL